MTAHSDRTIRTLVVDDHQVVCQGLRGLLNGNPDPETSARRLRPPGAGRARMGRFRGLERAHTSNFAAREPITLVPTVGRDLGKWRFAQRFLVVPWQGWGRRFESGGRLHQADDQRKRWSSSRLGLVRAAVKCSGWCPIRVDRPKIGMRTLICITVGVLFDVRPGIRGDEAPTSIGHTGGRDHRLGMRVPRPQFGRQ
jgi:hypothetical protein